MRLAGRKSISQLTVAQTVMMIAVGSLIIQPVSHRNIWITMLITLIMVILLISIEYAVMKSDALETFFYGKSIIVIENGQVNEKNLKKLRLTVEMLEVRMRQQSIQRISDIQWATLESNGQLGFMLKPDKQPATKEDIQQLISLIQSITPIPASEQPDTLTRTGNNIFTEVKTDKHHEQPPEHLK